MCFNRYQFIFIQVNLANEVKNNNNFTRFSRRLFIDNVLSRVTSPVSSALRAEATKKLVESITLKENLLTTFYSSDLHLAIHFHFFPWSAAVLLLELVF